MEQNSLVRHGWCLRSGCLEKLRKETEKGIKGYQTSQKVTENGSKVLACCRVRLSLYERACVYEKEESSVLVSKSEESSKLTAIVMLHNFQNYVQFDVPLYV